MIQKRRRSLTGQTHGGSPEMLDFIPEEVWAKILSFTSPRDIFRLSGVATTTLNASESVLKDRFIPDRFIPSDLLALADDAGFLGRFPSRKAYLHLCDHPLLIDGSRKSFYLDKPSGKKCFTISARELSMFWSDNDSRYWRWSSNSESIFGWAAELKGVYWLEIRGRIELSMLSPSTKYAAYLVFKTTYEAEGLGIVPAEAFISINNQEPHPQIQLVSLDPDELVDNIENVGLPTERDDGWMEVELGEYDVGNHQDGVLEMILKLTRRLHRKKGLVVLGIDIRSKEGLL